MVSENYSPWLVVFDHHPKQVFTGVVVHDWWCVITILINSLLVLELHSLSLVVCDHHADHIFPGVGEPYSMLGGV
jgi:hypothetical protein